MVLAGSSDGELHAFDAGLPDGPPEPEPSFDDGTGLEVFAYVPRPLLETLRRQAEEPGHTWGADGAIWVDDAFLDPRHQRVPDPARREWRTLAVGGLREGGHGYFALDITQPDELDGDGRPQPAAGRVPSCLGGDDGERLPPSCGPVPFPAPLWEFADALDEDGNGGRDMAQSWSSPNTGRIRVCGGSRCDPASEPNDVEDRFVAVVGGGLDPAFWAKRAPPRGGAPAEPDGNWLYMLDLETGRALFKRRLSGSAASEPAAVDTDRDGYLDTVYIGTTDGVLFKADIRAPGALGEVELPGGGRERRVTDPAWAPFPLFVAADESGRGRPLFYPPAVIHVAGGAGFALGFGAGDRHDLWAERRQEGRFYLILDTGYSAADHADGTLPLTEESYVELEADGAEESGEKPLLDPPPGKLPGWFLRLAPEERATSSAVAVAGVVAFSTFLPAAGGSDQARAGTRAPDPSGEDSCARGGRSRTYAVLAPSGDAVLREDGEKTRFAEVDGLAGVPFLQLAVGAAAEDPGDDGAGGTDPDLEAIRKELEEHFPPGCRFPNLTLSLRAALPGGGTRLLAPIPVCVREKNWREF
jgi:Tfp pilus tip-associated adhesin PilY1